MATTAERVRRIITEAADWSETPEDTALLSDLLTDALGKIELLITIEEEFELEISDDQAEGFSTVASVIAFVEARQ